MVSHPNSKLEFTYTLLILQEFTYTWLILQEFSYTLLILQDSVCSNDSTVDSTTFLNDPKCRPNQTFSLWDYFPLRDLEGAGDGQGSNPDPGALDLGRRVAVLFDGSERDTFEMRQLCFFFK